MIYRRDRGLPGLRLLALLAGILAICNPAWTILKSGMEQMQARDAQHTSNLLEAAEHLAEAAGQQPYRFELWEQAGHLALQGGQPEKAVAWLGRAEAGRSLQGWLDLGEAYRQSGDAQAGIAAWQTGVKVLGPTAELLERIWIETMRLTDYPAAEAALRSLVELRPEDGELRYRLGLLMSIRDPAAAVDQLDAAQNFAPALAKSAGGLRNRILAASLSGEEVYTLVNAGQGLAALDEWPLAVEAFSRAVGENPGYAEAWAYLGEAIQHLPVGQYRMPDGTTRRSDGLVEINRALELDARSLSGLLFKSLYWSRRGRFDLAERAIRNGLEYLPQEASLYLELGRVQAESGDLAQAAQAYLQASSLHPEEAAYQRRIVEFSLSQNYQIEALALPAARTAMELGEADVRNQDAMAQVLIRLGDLGEAKRLLSQAIEADENYAAAHLHLGALLLMQGDSAGALLQLRLAESLAPGSAIAEQAQRLIEGMLQ